VDKQGLIYFDGEDRVVERAEAEEFVNWTPVLDRPRYSRREVLKRATDQLENPDIDFVNSEDFARWCTGTEAQTQGGWLLGLALAAATASVMLAAVSRSSR
jgi:hypothetical protein